MVVSLLTVSWWMSGRLLMIARVSSLSLNSESTHAWATSSGSSPLTLHTPSITDISRLWNISDVSGWSDEKCAKRARVCLFGEDLRVKLKPLTLTLPLTMTHSFLFKLQLRSLYSLQHTGKHTLKATRCLLREIDKPFYIRRNLKTP